MALKLSAGGQGSPEVPLGDDAFGGAGVRGLLVDLVAGLAALLGTRAGLRGWYHSTVGTEDPGGKQEADPALAYLEELGEKTMSLAWGSDKTPEDRRRIVLAATIFGRQFEERMRERPLENFEDKEFQRFLMALMNAVISEFAERESIDHTAAAAFLSDVNVRDYVLEFNEVLEEFSDKPERSLDEHLKAAVKNREEHARWADHWSSG